MIPVPGDRAIPWGFDRAAADPIRADARVRNDSTHRERTFTSRESDWGVWAAGRTTRAA